MVKRILKKTKQIMIVFLSIVVLVVLFSYIYMQQAKFGKVPSGIRLEKIKASSHYKDGAFQNIKEIPVTNVNLGKLVWEYFFKKPKRLKPNDDIPSVKTNLLNLDPNENILVWFGHSSYFMQIDGKNMLVDPVFSEYASPVNIDPKAFSGTNVYTTEDMPDIDYLFISHDHWDHLDYETVVNLKSKVKKVICGLGAGEHFEHWGYNKSAIIEKDWNESVSLNKDFTVHFTPAQHFSGRSLKRNISVWTSFVLQTPSMQIFIGGDSGYDTHFAEIGKKFGVFDLAILENGQYDERWKFIHSMPEEVIQTTKDLNAKRLFPVHSAKFALAAHSWDEPLKRITALSKDANILLATPMIGEKVNLKDTTQVFSEWWNNVD